MTAPPPRRRPPISYFATTGEVVNMIKTSTISAVSVNPHSQYAAKVVPAERPQARLFLAWESWYQNPNAIQTLKEAMCGL